MEDLKGSELEKAIGRLDATAVAGFVQPSGSRTAKEASFQFRVGKLDLSRYGIGYD